MPGPTLPPPRAMKSTFGGHVPPDDVVGREETVGCLWEEVDRHSVRFNEVRRFWQALRRTPTW